MIFIATSHRKLLLFEFIFAQASDPTEKACSSIQEIFS